MCFLLTKTYMEVGNWEVNFRFARPPTIGKHDANMSLTNLGIYLCVGQSLSLSSRVQHAL